MIEEKYYCFSFKVKVVMERKINNMLGVLIFNDCLVLTWES